MGCFVQSLGVASLAWLFANGQAAFAVATLAISLVAAVSMRLVQKLTDGVSLFRIARGRSARLLARQSGFRIVVLRLWLPIVATIWACVLFSYGRMKGQEGGLLAGLAAPALAIAALYIARLIRRDCLRINLKELASSGAVSIAFAGATALLLFGGRSPSTCLQWLVFISLILNWTIYTPGRRDPL